MEIVLYSNCYIRYYLAFFHIHLVGQNLSTIIWILIMKNYY